MLLLVTIALVLVAAIALVIGFVSNQLPPIYISIACSFVAAVVLAMFSRLNRRRTAPAIGSGPAPLDTGPSMFERSAPTTTSMPPTATTPAIRGARPAQIEPEDEEEEEPVPVATAATRRPSGRVEPAAPEPEEEEEWPDDVVFPIEDYDDLRTAEILPLLEELDDDELEDVRDYEEDHRRRASILRRIDELLEGEEEMPPPPPLTRPRTTPAPPAVPPSRRPAFERREPASTREPEPVGGDSEEEEEAATPQPAPTAAAPAPTRPPAPAPAPTPSAPAARAPAEAAPVAGAPAARVPETESEPEIDMDEDTFPIAEYDKLRVAEILPLLNELDPDELEEVAERERAGAKRTTVLNRINRLLRPEKVKTPPRAGGGGTAKPASPPRFGGPVDGSSASGPESSD